MTEILAFMAANPYLSFFMLFLMCIVLHNIINSVTQILINLMWAVRGVKPTPVTNTVNTKPLDSVIEKLVAPGNPTVDTKEDDENQLKDCR